tara:strand:- start:36 stop:374 length:339 start_codon:yes stop_codon:yes gene_type:complete
MSNALEIKKIFMVLVGFFNARSIGHLIIIFIVFGLSGSASLLTTSHLLDMVSLDLEYVHWLIYWLAKIILLLFTYQVILLSVSIIFGEFKYFSKYTLKFIFLIRKAYTQFAK